MVVVAPVAFDVVVLAVEHEGHAPLVVIVVADPGPVMAAAWAVAEERVDWSALTISISGSG